MTLTAAQMHKAEKRFVNAKLALISQMPFFGSIICRRPPKFSDKVPTAGVNARGDLFINPEFVYSLSREEVIFLLAHETMHVVWMHAIRENGRDHRLWNIAADAVINQMLIGMNKSSMRFIKGGVNMPEYKDWAVEKVYDDLLKKHPEMKGNSSPQDGDGDGDAGEDSQSSSGSGSGYDPDSDPMGNDLDSSGASKMTEAEKERRAVETKQMVAEAAMAARKAGQFGGSLAKMVDAMLEVKTPWYSILEQYMVGRSSQRQSWAHPNRRYLQTAYLPCMEHEPSMGGVVIGIDTSGSIGLEEAKSFISHVNAIMEQCHPAWVKVVYCDHMVERVDEFEPDDYPLTVTDLPGGGGTDMGEVTRWIEDECEDLPDVCIIFTDGYTPFPGSTPCETVWAVTTDTDVPSEAGMKLPVDLSV